MPRGRGRAAKSPWADLASDFKESVESAKDEEIQHKLAEVALNEADNLEAKKKDEDLKAKKEAVKFAGEQYSSASKQNRLKIDYMKFILESRGKH